MFSFVFILGTGVPTTIRAPPVVRSSAQVMEHAVMLLRLRKGHSKPNMVAAPDVGLMASSVLLLLLLMSFAGWLLSLSFFFFLVPSCFPHRFQLFFFLFCFFLVIVLCFLFFSLRIVWCAGLHLF